MDLSIPQIAAIAAVVIVAAVAIAVYVRNRTTTRALKSQFGPEYGRAVEERGGPRKAEAELQARQHRVQKYHLRPLSAQDRDRFQMAWRRVQGLFVDSPKDATVGADDLLGQVMSARGYPDGDFDHRLEDLSVEHSEAVQNYRAAHEVTARHMRGEASTEDMRQAMIHYHTLFEDLMGEPEHLRAAS